MANTTSAREDGWRSINIDKYDPESAVNFDLGLFTPSLEPVSFETVQELISKIRAPVRTGNAGLALRQALENVPYGADEKGKEAYLAVVIEILQAIRQSDVASTLADLYSTNVELVDVLMKYLYRGMAASNSSGSALVTTPLAPTATGSTMASSVNAPTFGAGRSFQTENSSQTMSVLLSWHEKAVDVAGLGCINRVMTDRRTV